jgi:1,2-dihydroxy-3-keto-5-methylthiopentene dioxygenase
MAELRVYTNNPSSSTVAKAESVVRDDAAIQESLAAIGVMYEHWEVDEHLDDEAGQDEIIEAYRQPIDELMQRYGLESLDIVSISPDHSRKEALREQYLREHTHGNLEMRFFVDGRVLLYMRSDDRVYGLLCASGDLVSIPACMAHWFDMGDQPRYRVIRLFLSDRDGDPKYSGSDISRHYPLLGNVPAASASNDD